MSAETSVSFTGNSPDINNMISMFSHQRYTSLVCISVSKFPIKKKADYKHGSSLLESSRYSRFLHKVILILKDCILLHTPRQKIFFSLSDNFKNPGFDWSRFESIPDLRKITGNRKTATNRICCAILNVYNMGVHATSSPFVSLNWRAFFKYLSSDCSDESLTRVSTA